MYTMTLGSTVVNCFRYGILSLECVLIHICIQWHGDPPSLSRGELFPVRHPLPRVCTDICIQWHWDPPSLSRGELFPVRLLLSKSVLMYVQYLYFYYLIFPSKNLKKTLYDPITVCLTFKSLIWTGSEVLLSGIRIFVIRIFSKRIFVIRKFCIRILLFGISIFGIRIFGY